ncbi:MAG TPA: hypothetical protein VGL61_13480 [Kofleriaceae bacterium]|jgi:hypothetical protein
MSRFTAIVAALAMSSIAHADRPTAEKYFRAGAQAYSAQNFAAAAADFDEAYKAMPLPEIAFSAAQAYRRLYRVEPKPEYVQRAVELYRTYLDQVKTGGRVGDAADNLGEMQRELDRLKLSAAPAPAPVVEHTRLGVSVTIRDQHVDTGSLREIGDATGTVTPGLAATLDGKPLEPFALVEVSPEPHVIEVRADGYQPVTKRAVAIAGQSQLIEVELQPKPATIAVTTDDGAAIALDGRPVATAPASPIERSGSAGPRSAPEREHEVLIDAAAGKHIVTITLRGHEPFGRELAVTRGQAVTLVAPLAKTGRRKAVPVLLGGAGGLAVASLITGLVALDRNNAASDLRAKIAAGNQPPSEADAYDADVTSRDHFVDATWALGAGAIVLGATALALFYFDEPGAERVRIAPVATPTAAGATIVGHF